MPLAYAVFAYMQCRICIPYSVDRANLSKRLPGCRGAEKVDTLSGNTLDFVDSLERSGSSNNLPNYLSDVLQTIE